MGRLILAVMVVVSLGRSAAAERIAVTAVDQSEANLSETERTENAAAVRRTLEVWADAEAIDADRRLDVGVVRLSIDPGDEEISIIAELRLGVSDDQGQMVSVLSGSATVAIPSQSYRAKNLPRMRRDALVAATLAMLPKLRPHLHVITGSRGPSLDLVRQVTGWLGRLAPRPLS